MICLSFHRSRISWLILPILMISLDHPQKELTQNANVPIREAGCSKKAALPGHSLKFYAHTLGIVDLMERRRILIMNEDASLSSHLSQTLSALGYINQVELPHKRGVIWLSDGNTPVLVFLNMPPGPSAGLTVLANVREVAPTARVIVIAGGSQLRCIVDALRLGASDYVTIPFDKEQVQLSIERATEDQTARQARAANADSLIQSSFANPEMLEAFEIARVVSGSDVPVLITGESGVGKDVFARFIHSHSERAAKPSVKINCAALPSDLLESEMFGHERGAFTGAETLKLGKFELAHGGTIFLDEIGEMSPPLQAKLLHVLQDGEFCRLGGRRPLRVDTRIIAATNRKLEAAVARGEFREDLYFRLNVIRIKVPPLRERKDEIVYLCNYFVKKYAKKYSSNVEELPPEILRTFIAYDWPGNIRQLENVVKRYLILPGRSLDLSDLVHTPPVSLSTTKTIEAEKPASLPVTTTQEPVSFADAARIQPGSLVEFKSLKEISSQAAERAEKEMVLWMLHQTNWNKKLAALRLNICYKAFLNKINKWQMRRPATAKSKGYNKRGAAPLVLQTSAPLEHSEEQVEQVM